MSDRQEIDALIVGALYGELDAADRARLESHLSSHPEDRSALEALERTRATVRRGLADMPAAEPSPAISTMLLREAGRLAPRDHRAADAARGRAASAREPAESDGLWARFMRWARPVAMHPAFAGAAALILVAGTATALWVRDKGGMTEPDAPHAARSAAETEASDQGAHPPPTAPLAEPPVATGDGDGEGDFRVDLHSLDGKEDRNTVFEDVGGRDKSVAMGPMGSGGKQAPGARDRKTAKKGKDKRPEAAGYLELGPAKDPVAIKDLPPSDEAAKSEGKKADSADFYEGDDDAATSRGAKVAKQGQTARPEPKPIDPKLEEWAKRAHGRLAKLVADGKCPEAGRLGADIKDKAPEYYAANVANDRAIRACKSYIEGQSKKKAEKNYKSRSQSNTYDAESPADSTK